MKGEMTLVAISEEPAGNWLISGCATSVNTSFAKNASGTKTRMTERNARSSRSRNSSKCEIRVPSASCSGSPLILWGCLSVLGRVGVLGRVSVRAGRSGI